MTWTALPGPVLLGALPWNLPDMISIQVGAIKAFLAQHAVPVNGRHYYRALPSFIGEEAVSVVERTLVGDDLFGMMLFPDAAEDIRKRIDLQSSNALDVDAVIAGLEQFVDAVADDIVAQAPSLIGFTTTHMQYLASIAVARTVKQRLPDTRIVIGGLALHGQPAHDTLELFEDIDFIVVGEGETAVLRLIEHLDGRRAIEDVPQILYRQDGKVYENTQTETLETLDELPFPDYTDFFDHWIEGEERVTAAIPRASIETVRGCRWGRCSFCIEGLPTRGGFRAKSPERVVAEIEQLVQDFGILDYVMADPDVAFSSKVFQAIKTLDYDLSFMVELSGMVKVDQFHAMIDAGVNIVQIGIESFSPRMLEVWNKGVPLTKYVELLRLCSERGVRLIYNNIYRSPMETHDDLKIAMANMDRLVFLQPPRTSAFRVSVGSEIEQNPKAYNIAAITPSPEVAGYPDEIAKRVGVLISFNAGYGFTPSEDSQLPAYDEYLARLAKWREIWKLNPKRIARRGADFVRIEHHVGDMRYDIDIRDDVELSVIEACHTTRKVRELYRDLAWASQTAIDKAIDDLSARDLVFLSDGRIVSLVSVSPQSAGHPTKKRDLIVA